MRKAYSPGKPSELKIISILKNNKDLKPGTSLSKYISSKMIINTIKYFCCLSNVILVLCFIKQNVDTGKIFRFCITWSSSSTKGITSH